MKRLLENLAAVATNWTVKIVWRACRGEEFREIGAVAAQEAVDLIVMGTQGQTGLAYLPVGSVAERVVHTAPCPLLKVRPPAMGTTREESQETPCWTQRSPDHAPQSPGRESGHGREECGRRAT